MSGSPTSKPPTPLFLRILIWAWLVIQSLLLCAILATHGPGMDPDHRLLSSAAMIFASPPLSLLAMYVSVMTQDALSLNGVLFCSLMTWALCFAAGVVELFLLGALVKRLAGGE